MGTLNITETTIPEVRIVTPQRFSDPRGYFAEMYNRQSWKEAGIDMEFVQDNHSHSTAVGVIRGLHFQIPPFAQDKLVWVTRGAIFDVAVDIRRGSPTFGRHLSVVLSANEGNCLLVPAGFAHGFCTLESPTDLNYKVTQYYSPEHDKGLLWNDEALEIDWPVAEGEAIVSDRDRKHPLFTELPAYFSKSQR